MSASFYDLMKYARTGIASPSMTYYDKQKALAMCKSGFPISTITGATPLSFKSNGSPLISWSMKGNGRQTGTPTPDAPIMPDFCGKLVGADWTIPITCAGQTTPVYLGQTQTVRKVKKLVLDGTENFGYANSCFTLSFDGKPSSVQPYKTIIICNAYVGTNPKYRDRLTANQCCITRNYNQLAIRDVVYTDVEDFKAFLAAKYAAGTPVTVWYILANEETGIVNEPLAKIGNYADELNSEDAEVTIPTVKGQNTLTVDTELQPSSVSLTGGIK